MGRLTLFNRRLNIAGDDLTLPTFNLLVLHSIWMALIAYISSLAYHCTSPISTKTFLTVYLAQILLMLLVEITIIILSVSGTVAQKGARRHLGVFTHLQVLLQISECGMHSYGLYLSLHMGFDGDCSANASQASLILKVVSVWGLLTSFLSFVTLWGLFFVSDKTGPFKHSELLEHWRARLEWLFRPFVRTTHGKDAVSVVATEMADYFKDVDWAPSDVAVGLVLIKRQQKYLSEVDELRAIIQGSEPEKAEEETVCIDESTLEIKMEPSGDIVDAPAEKRPKTPIERVNREDLKDAFFFARYAEIVYDNLPAQTLAHDHLVISQTNTGIYQSPYLLAVSLTHKAIILAIRGTLSGEDILADLKLDLEPLEEHDGKVTMVHSGVIKTARNLLADIQKSGILKRLISSSKEYATYRIVVTGHSLGAGVAAILAYLLREEEHLENVSCVAYNPPGMLISEQGIPLFKPFCTTIVTGDDLICRMSLNSLDLIKSDLKIQLTSCNIPKWKILKSILFGYKEETSDIDESILKVNFGKGSLAKVFKSSTMSRKKTWRQRLDSSDDQAIHLKRAPMFLPGRIIYLERQRDFKRVYHSVLSKTLKEENHVYVPRWADADEFQELLISRTMLTDHSPFRLLKSLEKAPVLGTY